MFVAIHVQVCGLLCAAALTGAEAESRGPFKHLDYRLVGPAASGRVARVAGVSGDPGVYWAATAAGGVWKSVNGGTVWRPVFDDQPVSSIGSLAIAPSDPNVVWVGSGEANLRGNVGEGNGIYRSHDGGDTWTHVWAAEGQIGTIIVHPRDPDCAYAAVLGSPFGPGPDRGILRTTDGGRTWANVLHVDADTGAADVCFDPSNPRILFAGTWQVRRTPWSLTSGGPGSGLWRSRDGGDTWSRLTGAGLPDGPWGRIGVRVAASDARRVYALIEADDGGLFRSNDGGETWTRINDSRGLRQRAWYYSTLTIDPHSADVVWFPQVGMLKSVDGGHTVRRVKGGGWDYHDVWVDPADPARIVVGSDAGVSLSRDGGETWHRPALPIAQFYHIAVDRRTPYRVLGSVQDLGTVSGPSRVYDAEKIMLSQWHPVGGGEAGWVAADPDDPEIVWAGEYQGYISRYDGRTGRAAHVGVFPDNGSGHGAGDLRYRFQWTAPIVISPHDANTVYHAGNLLFRTTDRGQSWQAISPDLTRDDKSKQLWSGGPITGDNTGVEFYGTIFAVAESPIEAGVIWAGSDDGLVHVTRDGGGTWVQVTPSDLPEWATVSCIEASPQDAATAYVVADAHRLDDETPYLWQTADYGRTWTRLGRDLDDEIYLHAVRVDPARFGVLYLGTERGVGVSHDDGVTWRSLQLNMPTVAVVDLVVAGDDLVVGTLGRSAWILDDLTPVRDLSDAIRAQPAHLFPPRPADARRRVHKWAVRLGSRDGALANPPPGAIINYWLAEAPDGPITLAVVDAAGQVVRTLSSELDVPYTSPDHPDWDPKEERKPELTTTVGLNRAHWDLEYDKSRWVVGTRNEAGGRGPGPIALPGDYTLRLVVGDTTVTQPLHVGPDPTSTATPADRHAQFEFQYELRERMSHIADLIERIRSVRAQLAAHDARLAGRADTVDLRALGARIVQRIDTIEAELHTPTAEVDYDVLAGRHGGAKLLSRLGWLSYGSRAHEGPPTQGMRAVADDIASATADQERALADVLAEGVAEYNAAADRLGLSFVTTE